MGAILRSGFESGTLEGDGWNREHINTMPMQIKGSTSARKDINGLGGSYFVGIDNIITYNSLSKRLLRPVQESFVKFSVLATPTNYGHQSGPSVSLYEDSQGITWNGNCRVRLSQNATRNILVEAGISATIGSYGPGVIDLDGNWHSYIFQVRNATLANVGLVRVYKDFDFDNPLINLVGVNISQQHLVSTFLTLGFSGINAVGNTNGVFDDIAVNDITMSYDNGSGTLPVVGDIITGGISNATAIVTMILPGSTVLSGTLQLSLVRSQSLVVWNGLAADSPFTTEQITTPGGFSADIQGLDKNSGVPDDGYIVSLSPSADVSGKMQFQNSSGSGSNYSNVSTIPFDNSNYIYTNSPSIKDIYELENLSSKGITYGDIKSIPTVTVKRSALKTNTELGSLDTIVEHNGIETVVKETSPGVNNYSYNEILLENLPDGQDFAPIDIDNLRVGVKT